MSGGEGGTIFDSLWNPSNMGFCNMQRTLEDVSQSPTLNMFFPFASLLSSEVLFEKYHLPGVFGKATNLGNILPGLLSAANLEGFGIFAKKGGGRSH
jgi:hypothetical protein